MQELKEKKRATEDVNEEKNVELRMKNNRLCRAAAAMAHIKSQLMLDA